MAREIVVTAGPRAQGALPGRNSLLSAHSRSEVMLVLMQVTRCPVDEYRPARINSDLIALPMLPVAIRVLSKYNRLSKFLYFDVFKCSFDDLKVRGRNAGSSQQRI